MSTATFSTTRSSEMRITPENNCRCWVYCSNFSFKMTAELNTMGMTPQTAADAHIIAKAKL